MNDDQYFKVDFYTVCNITDILVKHAVLSLDEIKYLINIINLEDLLKYNNLPNDFINEYILPRLTYKIKNIYDKPLLYREKTIFSFKDIKYMIDYLNVTNKLSEKQRKLFNL